MINYFYFILFYFHYVELCEGAYPCIQGSYAQVAGYRTGVLKTTSEWFCEWSERDLSIVLPGSMAVIMNDLIWCFT